jgi:hypothetical protein
LRDIVRFNSIARFKMTPEKLTLEGKDGARRIVFRNYSPFDTKFFGKRETIGNYFNKPQGGNVIKRGFDQNVGKKRNRGTLKRMLSNKLEPLEKQTKLAIYELLKAEMQNKS